MAYQTIACVATAANYADYTTKAYTLGAGYPVTRFGLTFGCVDSNNNPLTLTCTNYTSPTQPLISGSMANNSNAKFLRVDLPNGPGTYRIKLGMSAVSTATSWFTIYNSPSGGTVLATVSSVSVPAGSVMGINGTVHASPTLWLANTSYIEVALTGPIYIGKSAAATMRLNAVMMEYQVAPLEPLKLRKYGDAGPLFNGGAGIATYGDGRYGYAGLYTDVGLAQSDVVSGLSKAVHHNTGDAGARLAEVHTITVSDGVGGFVNIDITVTP